MEVVAIYCNIPRKENKQLLQKLRIAVKKVTTYFTKEATTDERKHIAADKGPFPFHRIKHNHSFRSMDCTSSVTRRLHEEKFSYGRTKCESIAVNALTPFAMQEIFEELEGVKYLTVVVDTSNH
jgi:ribosome-associated toxin RatA of RatAB toxin-antitoxin module